MKDKVIETIYYVLMLLCIISGAWALATLP